MNSTQLQHTDVSNTVSDGRKFNFKLTEKKARSNLLKSAERVNLQVEAKQNCKNFRFSSGAYLVVAKKFIGECEMMFKNNTPIVHKMLNFVLMNSAVG